jgi:hypothetical protein
MFICRRGNIQPCSDYQQSSTEDRIGIVGFLVWYTWGFNWFGVPIEALWGFFWFVHGEDVQGKFFVGKMAGRS